MVGTRSTASASRTAQAEEGAASTQAIREDIFLPDHCRAAGHREPGICGRKAGTGFQNETGGVGWAGEGHHNCIPYNLQWKAFTKRVACQAKKRIVLCD